MKRIALNFILAASVLGCTVACNNQPKDSTEVADDQNDKKFDDTKMEDDAEFVVKAANGGMLEVKLGELAMQKGQSADIKDFGKMMVEDHSKANEELKALAAQKNVSIPANINEDAQKKYDDLAAKSGKDFDKAYANLMKDDHEEDIELFESEAKDGKNMELKNWASEKLPTLRHHLEMIQATCDKIK